MSKKSDFAIPNPNSQLGAVLRLMDDGEFRTLESISVTVGAPEASVSARLRDLRKSQFGGFNVTRRSRTRYVGGRFRTVFEYAIVTPEPKKKKASRRS